MGLLAAAAFFCAAVVAALVLDLDGASVFLPNVVVCCFLGETCVVKKWHKASVYGFDKTTVLASYKSF